MLDLIKQGRCKILPEPQMGTPIPASIPMDLSHISLKRDKYINDHLSKRSGRKKHKAINDFLIAEAHERSKNDLLLTSNIKDFQDNSDILSVDYDDALKIIFESNPKIIE